MTAETPQSRINHTRSSSHIELPREFPSNAAHSQHSINALRASGATPHFLVTETGESSENFAGQAAVHAEKKSRERNEKVTEQEIEKAAHGDVSEVEFLSAKLEKYRAKYDSLKEQVGSLNDQLEEANEIASQARVLQLKQEDHVKQLSDKLRSRDAERQDLRRVIYDSNTRIQRFEDDAAKQRSRHEAEVDQVARDTQARTIKSCQQDLDFKSQEVERLRHQVVSLEKSVEICKDQIFRLQPEQGLTDAQLAKAFCQLFDSVEDWLDRVFPDIDIVSSLKTAFHDKEFGGFIRLYFETSGVGAHTVQHPGCEHIWLRYLIAQHLFWYLLDMPQVYSGNSGKVTELLLSIEKAMADLGSKKDTEKIRRWRVETMTAMQHVPNIRDSEIERVHNVERNLKDLFVYFSRINACEPLNLEGLGEIISEAVVLSQNIHISLVEYKVCWEMFDKDNESARIVYANDLKRMSAVDAATGIPLRSLSKPVADDRGRVGVKLCVLQPALIKKKPNGIEDLVLVNATVLVAFDKPIPRGGKFKANSSAKQSVQQQEQVNVPENEPGTTNASAEEDGLAWINEL